MAKGNNILNVQRDYIMWYVASFSLWQSVLALNVFKGAAAAAAAAAAAGGATRQ